ncbi:type II toxin-antitoxin system VapC family toxin [Rugamonas sp. A1-17]|nr:type II toxin-antitoxin system VapC family toxin [Rugamonas sp. A1-17]
MMFILDTNVVSELRKVALGKANSSVQQWATSAEPRALYLSAITIHELEIGVLQLKRRNAIGSEVLRKWLDGHVLSSFSGRILPVDTAVAQRAAVLHIPQTRPWADAFIAATALVHDMIVVTRNVSDYQSTGVRLLNPWLH